MDIYLRTLEVHDALVSYKWRNNPNIWKYTGSKPDRKITKEIENNWIREVLLRKNEMRYAICIHESGEYIGNVQFTNINDDSAEFHIFIGEEKYWGMNLGNKATKLMLEIGSKELKLVEIYLTVSKNNIAAIKIYLKCGFSIVYENNLEIKMSYKNTSNEAIG